MSQKKNSSNDSNWNKIQSCHHSMCIKRNQVYSNVLSHISHLKFYQILSAKLTLPTFHPFGTLWSSHQIIMLLWLNTHAHWICPEKNSSNDSNWNKIQPCYHSMCIQRSQLYSNVLSHISHVKYNSTMSQCKIDENNFNEDKICTFRQSMLLSSRLRCPTNCLSDTSMFSTSWDR